MNILKFTDKAKHKFHKIVSYGYSPDDLKEYTHMQRIMNFNRKWEKMNDVRAESPTHVTTDNS